MTVVSFARKCAVSFLTFVCPVEITVFVEERSPRLIVIEIQLLVDVCWGMSRLQPLIELGFAEGRQTDHIPQCLKVKTPFFVTIVTVVNVEIVVVVD